mmetsp:Transcript_72263/g.193271  ORF Transcript_72263/g.193271 Transcript_72263/m.193271 type:complete len:240 (+) Transcript_72263:56-775(+)
MTRTVFVEFLHRPNALFARVALGVVFFCLAWVGSQASSNFSSHQRSGQTSLQAAPAAIVYLLMKGMKSAQFDSHIQYDVIVSWASSTGLAEELFQFTGSTQVGNDLKVTMQINAVSLQEADNALNLVLASPSAAVDIMSTLSGINNAFTVTGYKLVTISGKDSPYVPATTPEPPLVCDSSCATCTDSTPTGCSLCPFGSYQFQDSSGTKCVGWVDPPPRPPARRRETPPPRTSWRACAK